MGQHDKIKREINMIGLVLAKLLGRLSPTGTRHSEAEDVTKRIAVELQSELDIHISQLLEMSNDEVIAYLINDKKFSLEDIRSFANLLYELTSYSENDSMKTKLRQKVYSLYAHVKTNSRETLFLDVEYRLKELDQYST